MFYFSIVLIDVFCISRCVRDIVKIKETKIRTKAAAAQAATVSFRHDFIWERLTVFFLARSDSWSVCACVPIQYYTDRTDWIDQVQCTRFITNFCVVVVERWRTSEQFFLSIFHSIKFCCRFLVWNYFNDNIFFVNCTDISRAFLLCFAFLSFCSVSVKCSFLFLWENLWKNPKTELKRKLSFISCQCQCFYWQVKFFSHFFILVWIIIHVLNASAQHPKKVADWNKKPKITTTTSTKEAKTICDNSNNNISSKRASEQNKTKKREYTVWCGVHEKHEQFYSHWCWMDLLLRLWLIRLDIERISFWNGHGIKFTIFSVQLLPPLTV